MHYLTINITNTRTPMCLFNPDLYIKIYKLMYNNKTLISRYAK